ncbi:MAG TPA: potassium-transporting ATPase subunit C [Terracidiphilus sp.]
MLKELAPGLKITIAFTILTGLLYPAAMTALSSIIFPHQANGSLVTVAGKLVGSSLIGQPFSKPEYFHPRPSSAGSGYDATNSGGSNLGPTSAKLLLGTTKLDEKGKEIVDFDGIADRLVHYCIDNQIPFTSSAPLDRFNDPQGNLDDVKLIKAFNHLNNPLVFSPKIQIPADAVTGSASGLDPNISPANAELQAGRVARSRGASSEQIRMLIARATDRPDLGFIGEPRVNVLLLNVSLDQQFPRRK